MKAVILYESLTGNTRKASLAIARELGRAGVVTTVCPVTAVDYQAVAEADLVVIGSWTDGLLFVGQKPGRAGRLRKLPFVAGKRCVVFCTYAIDAGKTLDKLQRIVEDLGGDVVGGMTIHRNNIDGGAKEFVDRVLEAVSA